MFKRKKKSIIEPEIEAIERNAERVADVVVEKVRRGVIKSVEELINDKDTVAKLKDTVATLKAEVAELEATAESTKSKQRVQESEWKHGLKMKDEMNSLGVEKKGIELERKYQEKEMSLLKAHQDKYLALLDDAKKDFQHVFAQVLAALPDTKMAINLSNQAKPSCDNKKEKDK